LFDGDCCSPLCFAENGQKAKLCEGVYLERLLQLYFKTKIAVIINGNVEATILIFIEIRPTKNNNSIKILRQVNPARLNILLTCF
jgi:hypothetical protein